ncbi:unnamed protein product [Triticum turgidum subsp. durum]|uniref:Uncharacterized protein n=1 Tax=Triticum turgidum subsp. durum TaxID=4567 RepID=A0A9R0YXJ7_TRITD|nr:unnamed protein product [Triticum turgidum subsp. durum]
MHQVALFFFFMSLHTVQLEDCGEWTIILSLEMLRFLKRLKLRNMQRVREVSIPSVDELVLNGMPDLQRCFCTSMGNMKSSLRVLEIKSCPALEVFDLFQKGHNYEIEHKSWLPSMRKLIMCDCPHLHVQSPLPPSAKCSEILISRVSTIMTMEGSSMETFKISGNTLLREMMALNDKNLAFYNLKDIKYLEISSCGNLTSISFKGLSQLISLKSLKIGYCRELFSLDVPEHSHEDMPVANDVALSSLESLFIIKCGITWKWLSLMMRHSPILKELDLYDCPQLKLLRIQVDGKIQSNHMSATEASSSGYLDDALRSSVRVSSGYIDGAWASSVIGGLMHIPLNLRKITICESPNLIFDGSKECFIGFTSLEELQKDAIENGKCLLPQSLEQLFLWHYSRETLRPCFVGNRTHLRRLQVNSESLEYLQLDSCTALEELEINKCECFIALEGMQSLGTLRSLVLFENSRLKSLQLHSCRSLQCLEIYKCSSLVALEGLQSLVNLKHMEILKSPALNSLTILESYGLFPALESLKIDDLSPLNTSFCKGLTCLRSLKLIYSDATRLTDEQESALLLLSSLQELQFKDCRHLLDLPSGLRGLPSLKTLKIIHCNRISGLPKDGLPSSLKKLATNGCKVELSKQCRLLATSKLKVKIYKRYVN